MLYDLHNSSISYIILPNSSSDLIKIASSWTPCWALTF